MQFHTLLHTIKTWGFCISYKKFKLLDKNAKYRVVVNSSHQNGYLDYIEPLIKGKSKRNNYSFIYLSPVNGEQ